MNLNIKPVGVHFSPSKYNFIPDYFSKIMIKRLNEKGKFFNLCNKHKLEAWYSYDYKSDSSIYNLLKDEVENTVKFNTDAVLEFIHTTWGLTDYHLIDSVKDISTDIILTHITELGGHDQSNPIDYSAIRDSWVSFFENVKDGSLFQDKPFRLAQELTIINYFQSNLTFNGKLEKKHLNRYAFMVGSKELGRHFQFASNSSFASSDSSLGVKSPGSPVTYHKQSCTTNGKGVAYAGLNSPFGVIEADPTAAQHGSDGVRLSNDQAQEARVLGLFPTEVDAIADSKGSETHMAESNGFLEAGLSGEIQDSSQVDVEAGHSAAQRGSASVLLSNDQAQEARVLGLLPFEVETVANRVFSVPLNSFFSDDNSRYSSHNCVGKRRLLDDQSEDSSQGSDQSLDSDNGKNRINKMLLLKCMCLSSSILSLIWLYYFVFFRAKP